MIICSTKTKKKKKKRCTNAENINIIIISNNICNGHKIIIIVKHTLIAVSKSDSKNDMYKMKLRTRMTDAFGLFAYYFDYVHQHR